MLRNQNLSQESPESSKTPIQDFEEYWIVYLLFFWGEISTLLFKYFFNYFFQIIVQLFFQLFFQYDHDQGPQALK